MHRLLPQRRRSKRRIPPPLTSSAITDSSGTLDGSLQVITSDNDNSFITIGRASRNLFPGIQKIRQCALRLSGWTLDESSYGEAATRFDAGIRMLPSKPAARKWRSDHTLVWAPVSAMVGTFLATVGRCLVRHHELSIETHIVIVGDSLRHFLAAGFDGNILIPASNLVAANHSCINIVAAFFAVIKGWTLTRPMCNVMP